MELHLDAEKGRSDRYEKWIAAVLSIAMLMSFGINAYAGTESETEPEEENGKSYTGVIFDTDRSQEFTEEELERIEEKLASVEALKNSPVQNRLFKFTLPGFTIEQQENDIYCVPACVKSSLTYITGKADSQSSIAKDMGTSPDIGGTFDTKIAPYMNQKQSRYTYLRSDNPSASSIGLLSYTAIVTNDAPAFICIKATTTNWLYTTKGHCLNIRSVYTDKSKVEIADPLGGKWLDYPYYGKCPTYSEKTVDELALVCRTLVW